MMLSVTNRIQLPFAGALLILMLERLSLGRREKLRLASEPDAAREIQRTLLPQAAPAIAIASAFVPTPVARSAAIVSISALLSSEQVMIVADIAGKGLPAALVGTAFRSEFRASSSMRMTDCTRPCTGF